MISVTSLELYKKVLKEHTYDFCKVYMFKNFVVTECFQGVSVNWEDTKVMVKDITTFYNSNGSNVVYISNRINSYSIVASDWLKFFKNGYSIKSYCIVSKNKAGLLNLMMEKLFFKKKIKHFSSLFEALNYVNNGMAEMA